MTATARGNAAERERLAWWESYGWDAKRNRVSKGAYDLWCTHPSNAHPVVLDRVKAVGAASNQRQRIAVCKSQAKTRYMEALAREPWLPQPGGEDAHWLLSVRVAGRGTRASYWRCWELVAGMERDGWEWKETERWLG